jgi:VanZ family protein
MSVHQNKYSLHLINNLRKLSDRTYIMLAIVWTGVTLYLSLISARSASKFNVWDFVGVDKLGHLVFYLIFSFLWCMALARNKTDKKNILFFSISFGVLMEICQLYLFNGRSFELYDIVANVIGSIVGVILFKNIIN